MEKGQGGVCSEKMRPELQYLPARLRVLSAFLSPLLSAQRSNPFSLMRFLSPKSAELVGIPTSVQGDHSCE